MRQSTQTSIEVVWFWYLGIVIDPTSQIQDKQFELDKRLQELETKLASKDGNSNISEENNSSTADLAQTATSNTNQNLQHDYKFDIVMYGIDDCNKGTPRNSSVTEIITKVNENASPLSIHDLHRLGKYQEESRHPRPVLIKFKKAIDVRIYSPIQNKCP